LSRSLSIRILNPHKHEEKKGNGRRGEGRGGKERKKYARHRKHNPNWKRVKTRYKVRTVAHICNPSYSRRGDQED
jgi:hypothetical protein